MMAMEQIQHNEKMMITWKYHNHRPTPAWMAAGGRDGYNAI